MCQSTWGPVRASASPLPPKHCLHIQGHGEGLHQQQLQVWKRRMSSRRMTQPRNRPDKSPHPRRVWSVTGLQILGAEVGR